MGEGAKRRRTSGCVCEPGLWGVSVPGPWGGSEGVGGMEDVWERLRGDRLLVCTRNRPGLRQRILRGGSKSKRWGEGECLRMACVNQGIQGYPMDLIVAECMRGQTVDHLSVCHCILSTTIPSTHIHIHIPYPPSLPYSPYQPLSHAPCNPLTSNPSSVTRHALPFQSCLRHASRPPSHDDELRRRLGRRAHPGRPRQAAAGLGPWYEWCRSYRSRRPEGDQTGQSAQGRL